MRLFSFKTKTRLIKTWFAFCFKLVSVMDLNNLMLKKITDLLKFTAACLGPKFVQTQKLCTTSSGAGECVFKHKSSRKKRWAGTCREPECVSTMLREKFSQMEQRLLQTATVLLLDRMDKALYLGHTTWLLKSEIAVLITPHNFLSHFCESLRCLISVRRSCTKEPQWVWLSPNCNLGHARRKDGPFCRYQLENKYF